MIESEEVYWRTGDELEFLEGVLTEPRLCGGKNPKLLTPTIAFRKQFLQAYLTSCGYRSVWHARRRIGVNERTEAGLWETREVTAVTEIEKDRVLAWCRTELEKLK